MDIEYLGLTSLHQISNGGMAVALNPKLCYLHNLDMSQIFTNSTQEVYMVRNKNETECDAAGLKCHAECSHHGCWGPGPDKCLNCKTMRVTEINICVPSCDVIPMHYQVDNNTCKKCHEQCARGCSGPDSSQCFECKQVKVSGQNNTFRCMLECPVSQPYLYTDENRICRQCDTSCDTGCTGSSSTVKVGGCYTCLLAINETLQNGTVRYLPRDQDFCPSGYYVEQYRSDIPHPLLKKQVCQPCHHLCLECNGPGNGNCSVCRFFRYTNRFLICLDVCPLYTFANDGECFPCDDQCLGGCDGPNSSNCDDCLNLKVFRDEEALLFDCVKKCPPELPKLVNDTDPDKPTMTVCAADDHPVVTARVGKRKEEERKNIITIAIPVSVGVLVLGILLGMFVYYWRRCTTPRPSG